MNPKREQPAIRRGDLYWVNLGADQHSLWRAVLVIQNDIGNRFGNSVIITPLIPKPQNTSFLFGVEIQAGLDNVLTEDCIVLLSQIRTIEKDRFKAENYLGKLGLTIMTQVDKALELSLGLSFIQRLESRQGRAERVERHSKNNVGS